MINKTLLLLLVKAMNLTSENKPVFVTFSEYFLFKPKYIKKFATKLHTDKENMLNIKISSTSSCGDSSSLSRQQR